MAGAAGRRSSRRATFGARASSKTRAASGGESCSAAPSYPLLALHASGRDGVEPAGKTDRLPSAELVSSYLTGPGPGDRVEITSGSFAVETWGEEAGAAGSYDVVLADGTRLTGRFDAAGCPELAASKRLAVGAPTHEPSR